MQPESDQVLDPHEPIHRGTEAAWSESDMDYGHANVDMHSSSTSNHAARGRQLSPSLSASRRGSTCMASMVRPITKSQYFQTRE
jgi:hypothetical protein